MGTKLYHGDCLRVMGELESGSIDLVLTDPPYTFTTKEKESAHGEIMRVARGCILFSPPENQWVSGSQQYGFWVKPISTKNTSRRYSRFVEMLFFYGHLKWNTGRHWSQYTNVYNDLVEGGTQHPYEKPESLIKRLVLNHTDPGDTVLDPYMGSGTTGVVCNSLGRNFIGIEIDAQYYNMAKTRIER